MAAGTAAGSTLSATALRPDAGERLDRFLARHAPAHLSRSRIKALVKAGAARGPGGPITDPNAKVAEGATYVLAVPPPRPAEPEAQDLPLSVLFEDADLIVVDKAAGMAVHPAPGSWDGTLVNALLHHCQGGLPGINGVERPGIVHRLDKDTSGVMVAAKSEAAMAGLSEAFRQRALDRRYLALTRGAPRPLSGTVDAPLGRDPKHRTRQAVAAEGDKLARHARTHYRALAVYGLLDADTGLPAAAKLECTLDTGRTHQVRVHMAHIGAPLLGDSTYNPNRGVKAWGEGEAFRHATETARAMRRQALHAASLAFEHPVTGEALSFAAPLPPDMAELDAALEAMPR